MRTRLWAGVGRGILAMLVLGFFLMGPLMAVRGLHKAKSTETWPTTPGTVIGTSFGECERGFGDGPRYTEWYPVVSYGYAVDGKAYTSNRVAANNLATNRRDELHSFLAGYPTGASVLVHYCPSDPSQAVLVTGIPAGDFCARELGGIAIAVILGIVLIAGAKLSKVSTRQNHESASPSAAPSSDSPMQSVPVINPPAPSPPGWWVRCRSCGTMGNPFRTEFCRGCDEELPLLSDPRGEAEGIDGHRNADPEQGAVVVQPARIIIDKGSTCRICGADLTKGVVVRCAKCETPHHRDCWDFNGRCSTFACGEMESV